ncbi:FeoA domain protein [Gimesia panareensis]|uniref:FeoA domain protein n=2 Tax=Gimesia panareensis TaxID=2527978 RepID=A0A517QBV7_9PLAN|nr:FeoA domain protein [Gimesia panareensis]QDU51970.1 FeoA domain protein [Gimesia panareensis]
MYQSHVAVSLYVETFKEMTLNQIVKGQIARITNISGEDAISIRLMEMGLIDGERIQLLGKAPLGDPLEFAIRGYRLSLRLNEARCVEVELV